MVPPRHRIQACFQPCTDLPPAPGLPPPGAPAESASESQGHADAVVLQLAGQHALVELVEVDQLDQVRELGGPIVQAEEHLPIILTLRRHKSGRRLGAAALPAGPGLGEARVRLGSAETQVGSAGQVGGHRAGGGRWGVGTGYCPVPGGHPGPEAVTGKRAELRSLPVTRVGLAR